MSAKPRSRASTLQDAAPEVTELRSRIHLLEQPEEELAPEKRVEWIHKKLELAHSVRQTLLGGSGALHMRDTFRHLNGFQSLIMALRHVSQIWSLDERASEEQQSLSIRLFQAIFGILAAALQQHKGNQKYFRLRVERGGWLEIRDLLRSNLPNDHESSGRKYQHLLEEVFGCLLACALNDESMTGFFKKMKRTLDTDDKPPTDPNSANAKDITAVLHSAELGDRLRMAFEADIPPLATVCFEDAVLLMFELWRGLKRLTKDEGLPLSQAVSVLPAVIHHLASLSTRNLVALHGIGLVRCVLDALLCPSNEKPALKSELYILATVLLQLGISTLDDAHFLYQHARSSPMIAELLLASLRSSRSPPYIHFDLSSSGYASVELPGIGRTFPPTASGAGYSLSLWFQIAHFDHHAHTTVFGAFDASQTCFLLVYLEKDTHNLILQTSVSSSRPSVRFKSIAFNERRWYHVVITHRRPKATSSSRASLFIDGEFVEQVKSQYPATAPSSKGASSGVPSPLSNRRTGAIQAFLGTPQDLASQLGRGVIRTQWRLASATLFADVLSDDLIAVYFELGPRYSGNFQDCLGSFQTYRASAALNLRNESLHPGKEEKSDIVTAIRSKAGTLLPETCVLLNISADVVLDDDDHNNIDETHLLNFISKAAGKNLRNVTKGGRNALAINGAMPFINDALLHPSGFAILTGDPVVVVPQSLDDAAWRIGGCAAVGLALLEAAQKSEDILRALNILLESVQDNWRNSEAMERENGFGVLSTLLSGKLSQPTPYVVKASDTPQVTQSQENSTSPPALEVLAVILRFVGYNADKPENSVINNPLAYRILLVDMEFWRNAEPSVQKLYYEQFIAFGVRSKYHLFNTKRLSRMRQFPRSSSRCSLLTMRSQG